ncbi:MAG: hypothetical protein ACJA0S_000180 [Rickettsiales bacterium]|jgi:hypothetical protein
MLKNKFISQAICATILVFSSSSFADQYPNISGKALFEIRADRITSTDKSNIESGNANAFAYANAKLSLSKQWSVITDFEFEPVTEQRSRPEIYREILGDKRGNQVGTNGLAINEIKVQYVNKDARFFFGKFNPAFGSAFEKEKRIGVFATDFTQDYKMEGKLGAGFTALLQDLEITADLFFNDTTALSNTAIRHRGAEKRSDGLAGNTSSPTSYSVSAQGQDLFGVRDLFYNVGYRHLQVDKISGRDDEKGFVGGLEYLLPLSSSISLIPFIEVASIDNFTGQEGYDVLYSTLALMAKYSGWSASIASVTRDIDLPNSQGNTDRQLQYSIGYKFTNNFAIDLSRMNLKENGHKATVVGALVSYIYNF